MLLEEIIYKSKALGFRDAYIELLKISIEENIAIPDSLLDRLDERMQLLYPIKKENNNAETNTL